jgi:hypothetical protein
VINIAHDTEGLRKAALEYFEEALDAPMQQQTLAAAKGARNRERVLEAARSRRTLSPGYYSRVEFLLWLQQMRDMGASISDLGINAAEIEGLRVLALARSEFADKHPECPKCGTPNRLTDIRCHKCGEQLSAGKK